MNRAFCIGLALLGLCSWVGGSPYELLRSHQEKQVLAAVLVLEAGGEGQEGMQAVMNVIMNRAGGSAEKFYLEAIRPKQFSVLNSAKGWPWRNFSPTIERARSRGKLWTSALALVEKAQAQNLPDITKGATHYYATSIRQPSWASEMEETLVLKNHRFLKAPDYDPVAMRAKLAMVP